MSPSKLASFALVLAASSALAGEAEAATRYDLSLHLGGGLGHVHESASGATAVFQQTGTPPSPFATGDDSVWNARGTIGATFEAQLFDQGDGLPRFLLLGGATVFLGNRVDGDFATLHGGAAKDTGVTITRPFTIDLALGGVFPLGRGPSAIELKGLVGLGLSRRGTTAWTDETNDGGKREETTDHAIEAFPFFAALVDVPLCKACSARPTKLRFGLVARSLPSAHLQFATPTARVYDVGADNYVELEPQVGLVIPL